MSYTGFESFTLNDLEREAYRDKNALAIEICNRLGDKKRMTELTNKRTAYKDCSYWSDGKLLAPEGY